MAGVEEVLSQITAEHPLSEDPSLLQLLLCGSGLHEGAQECDQLPVLLGYWRTIWDHKHYLPDNIPAHLNQQLISIALK